MRAALEAVAMGVRHNLEAFDSVRPGESSGGPAPSGAAWPARCGRGLSRPLVRGQS